MQEFFIDILIILIGILFILVLFVLYHYIRLTKTVEERARKRFDAWCFEETRRMNMWREEELATLVQEKANLLFARWQENEEKNIREDAIKRSHSVIKGKITEHFLPFLECFPFNPRDARFIGTPVDLVVFDGLSDGECRQIIFIEVKSGQVVSLSSRERSVRECIRQKNVLYEVVNPAMGKWL